MKVTSSDLMNWRAARWRAVRWRAARRKPAGTLTRCCWLFPLLALPGCGGSGYEYANVEGIVTLNKKPLSGAMVRFYPISDRKEQLPIATGFTDAVGFYTLSCRPNQLGAVVGSNRAVVSWPSKDLREAGNDGQPLPAPSAEIPLHYRSPSDTPLRVEVKASETNNIDLPLED